MQAELEIDLSGLNCPLPILRTKKALASLPSGAILKVITTDPATPADFADFCRKTGHQLLEQQTLAPTQFLFWIQCK